MSVSARDICAQSNLGYTTPDCPPLTLCYELAANAASSEPSIDNEREYFGHWNIEH
jgi:hypothetical protein